MKKAKRIGSLILSILLCVCLLASCAGGKKTINIYSSSEDYRNVTFREMLGEKFPEYNINLVDSDTGTIAAKIKAEGADSDADIVLELENGYMTQLSEYFAELKDVDFSVYTEDVISPDKKSVPIIKVSGAIVVDKKALAAKNLPVPTSYDDLLKPEYKGLISMPSPKSSGTGYIFYLYMVNERGEQGALEYFDKLAQNMSGQGFTTSGSGPVNAVVMGEAAIGLSLTNLAVNAINEGTELEILYFGKGAPYTLYSCGVIAGKDQDPDVMKVFDYIVSDIIPTDKKMYSPERIYKVQDTQLPNYPTDIPYGNMNGIDDSKLKEELLAKWKY